jgi:predicted O-linked N-acetylglucosamine transferase (SPINDLY family)
MLSRIQDLFRPKAKPGATLPEAAPIVAPIARPDPNPHPSSDPLFDEAQSLQQQGRLEKAVELYDVLIDRTPDRAELYYKRANALNGLGRPEAALDDYDRAITRNPTYTYAFCNRGSVLERLGRREEALASYDRAIVLDPKDFLTHYNRGSVLKDLERLEEALTSYETAIACNGEYAEAYVNRGIVLQQLRRHEAAIESFDRAIALKPVIAEAFQGRGVSLYALKRLKQALLDYNSAISLKPDVAGLYLNRGNLLSELLRHDLAAADFLKVTELDPENVEGYHSLGSALVSLKNLEPAVASFDKAIALYPSGKFLIGTRRAAKMQLCRWEGLSDDLDLIEKGVSAEERLCNPLTLAALLDSPGLQRRAAQIWVQDQILDASDLKDSMRRIADPSPITVSPSRSTKIRIGYFSADFRAHPVGFLTAGLFERHDRSRFEVTAFAFGPETNDAMAARIARAFDRCIDVRQKTDLEVVEMARDLKIDIAIDLHGFSEYCRTKIFALRAAPVQINFVGYPGTMGAGFMDYLIADGTIVPRALQAHYNEKIVYMPDCFLPFDSSYAIAQKTFSREELGLPSAGFVFCCFNGSHKITPEVFDRWMRILSRVEGSVLWLSKTLAAAAENLRKEALRRGVDDRRLIFAERMASLPEHLARVRAADLFLDTFPYNAHATALDALWAGVPLLTYPGESFASRVAASLLRTVGLPELIAASPSDYEAQAQALAADPVRLGRLRQALAQRSSPLFDTERYTRALEAAYRTIYDRHQNGEAPAHINEHLAGAA